MIRSMNTDNKHNAVTVPVVQTASKQVITCGVPLLLVECDFCVYCRADYEVTLRGDGSKLEELHLWGIEKMGDINLNPVNDKLDMVIEDTNLHGCLGLTKPWMALIQSLRMAWCNLEAGDISVTADSIQAYSSPTGAESASPCRLQELDLKNNSLTGAGADIARIISCIPLIDLGWCKLEAADISAIAGSIQACTSPTGSSCMLQKLDLNHNSLTGAGPDIARIIPCVPLCTEIYLGWCDLNDDDFQDIVNAITHTHSDRHKSVHDQSTPDERQTKRFKPASPGPAAHIYLYLQHNKFSAVKTVRLLLDNLPLSLRELWLDDNQFNKEEIEEIRRTYKDKHPNRKLVI